MRFAVRTSIIGARQRRAVLVCLAVALCAIALAPTTALGAYAQSYGFVSKCSMPTMPVDFAAKGMALSPRGNLLVSTTDDYLAEITTTGVNVATLGLGVSLTQVNNVASNGSDIWVQDEQSRVKKLDSYGNDTGVTIPGFNLADGIAVDASGCVYVADEGGSAGYGWQVSKYNSAGTLITRFGTTGTSSNADWMWSGRCISIGPDWSVYVADSAGGMIRKYAPNAARTSYTPAARWASSALFPSPISVAADAKGNVFVLDSSYNTITKLNSAGTVLAHWGGSGTTNGVFTTPWSLVVAPNGNVFVDDRDALTVQQFQQLDLGPLTSAAANVTVKKGKTAKLKYRADEDFSSTVNVTIKVYKGSKLKATIKCGTVGQGAWHTKSWKCKLAKGSYKWKVYATDAAGHSQQNVASKTLKVK